MRRGLLLMAAGGGLIVLGVALAVLSLLGFASNLMNKDGQNSTSVIGESLEIEPHGSTQLPWLVRDTNQPFYISINSRTPIQVFILDPNENQVYSFDTIQLYDEYEIGPRIAGNYSIVLNNPENEVAEPRVFIASEPLVGSLLGVAGGALSVLGGFATIIAGGIFLIRDRKKQKLKYQVHRVSNGRPIGILIIAVLTIISALIALGNDINSFLVSEAVSNSTEQESASEGDSIIEGLWETGEGSASLVIGWATLARKGWAWKSNVVSSINASHSLDSNGNCRSFVFNR